MESISLRPLADWLLPPAGPLLLLLAGLLLVRYRLGRWLAVTGGILLYAFATPLVSHAIIAPLQDPFAPPSEEDLEAAEFIVVLGAGYRAGAVEFGGETVNDLALERLRYAASLHHRTGLPVMATGGAAEDREPEARWMAEVLEELGVRQIVRESRARDTRGNALYSAELLQEMGVGEVLLVTHAHHLRRAVPAFENTGLRVTAAPTGAFVPSSDGVGIGTLRPTASALRVSWLAMHEYLGILWYFMRGDLEPPGHVSGERSATYDGAAGE
ncbi:YdcF family protein [Thioalkalivibrio sp. ALJ24]|uniref:YdcF family protein n=1 Tax=Thioalkalivibrio sp. ALJ24 TaxID=545276 RepID=UPI00037E0700|nr:YdcF family protein [Thioalkalivibrio sp. ALJ24]